MTGLLYLEGQLDADRAQEVSAHLASCAACSRLLRALERKTSGCEKRSLRRRSRCPRVCSPRRSGHDATGDGSRRSGLGIGGAYTLWSGFVEPWLAQAAQAGFHAGKSSDHALFQRSFLERMGRDAKASWNSRAAPRSGTVRSGCLRRQWRRFTAGGLRHGGARLALALPLRRPWRAEIHRGDPSYTLPAGQEVQTDLIVTADRTRIDGDVDGDLIVFSSSVTVNGHVKGDILGFAQESA